MVSSTPRSHSKRRALGGPVEERRPRALLPARRVDDRDIAVRFSLGARSTRAAYTRLAVNNDYVFVTRWRFEGTRIEEVADVLFDAPSLPRWWPSVYLDVRVVEAGDPTTGLGRVVHIDSRGWLPYTLSWTFRVTESRTPERLTLEAWGDFVGTGRWTLRQEGADAHVTYDWRVRAEKPLLRYASLALKPLFAANHRWAMARGEESLRLELARRRANTDEERARIPPPPRR